MPPCLTLNITRYVSRVNGNNPEKGAAHSPIPLWSSYLKGSLRVAVKLLRPISQVLGVFANGPGDLGIIRYVWRVKWSNPEKWVAPDPTPRCNSYLKGAFGSPSTTVANFTYYLFNGISVITWYRDSKLERGVANFWRRRERRKENNYKKVQTESLRNRQQTWVGQVKALVVGQLVCECQR